MGSKPLPNLVVTQVPQHPGYNELNVYSLQICLYNI